MVDDVIIMAGGSGTRLWPASIQAMPKQFLDLTGEGSLLRRTVERAVATGARGRIVIVTLADQVQGVRADLSNHPELAERVTVLPEPTARNTAPAIAFAVHYLQAQGGGGGVSLVLAADHALSPVDAFTADVAKADALARDRYLVTFGVRPNRPETGYGYLEIGAEVASGYVVREFKEKPDRPTAETYAASGRHFWNSGMFVFENRFFLSELAKYEGTIADAFAGVVSDLALDPREMGKPRVVEVNDRLRSTYVDLPKISVDYAVMERSDRCAMVPASFSWNDVGSWDEVAKLDAGGREDVFEVEAEGNFVHSDLPVALCGVDGLHVVVKNGIVLVCRQGESQLVKDVVARLQESGRSDLL